MPACRTASSSTRVSGQKSRFPSPAWRAALAQLSQVRPQRVKEAASPK
jgi:hypothetical protein